MRRVRIARVIKNQGKLRNQRAQQVAEYAVLIALVLGAAIAMKVYVQRGLQARYHAAVLKVGNDLRTIKGNAALPVQYEPYYVESTAAVSDWSNEQVNIQSPLPLKGKTDIKSRRVISRQEDMETLSGNYGD